MSKVKINITVEIQKFLDLVLSGKNVFLTGKAGTGKSTTLRYLLDIIREKNIEYVVLAPTGIAAKNVGGATIHSLFQLPFAPYLPGHKLPGLADLNQDNIEILERIEILFIDEISMVRCDTLDKVDLVLKSVRKNNLPFGGVQVVLIGDLMQLMPVVKDEHWEILKTKYDSPYFFSSKVYDSIDFSFVELTKVQRQSDRDFIRMLNHLRIGKPTNADICLLNSRHRKKAKYDITTLKLATKRSIVHYYNQMGLSSLSGNSCYYYATIENRFPREEYPTDRELELKEGAWVMFAFNDCNKPRRFVNGDMGKVLNMDENSVCVKKDNGEVITLSKMKWDYEEYFINPQTKCIETHVVGSFSQIPLKLAWSVTIHKSQGLTLDKVIIDPRCAFCDGQIYVALSRCKTLEGISLTNPVNPCSITANSSVMDYLKKVNSNLEEPDNDDYNHYVEGVHVFKESKTIFPSMDCKMVMAYGGYYIKLKNKYLKVVIYSVEETSLDKNLWIKKDGNGKYNIVHNCNGLDYKVGTISCQKEQIVFIDPKGYKVVSKIIDGIPIVVLNERTKYYCRRSSQSSSLDSRDKEFSNDLFASL